MNRKLLSIFLLIFLTVISLPWQHAFAQDEGEQYADDEELIFDEVDVTTFLKPIEDAYKEISFNALSKAYWTIGKFDVNDNDAIDNYLLINECEMFKQFYQNDFEWNKIREATRGYIKKNMNKFPTTFEILMPLDLDRYDVDKKEFIIKEHSRVEGLRRLDFSNNPQKETCGRPGDVPNYPKNIILILNRPFSMEKVPVRPEIAEMYLDELRRKYEHLSVRLQAEQYERKAYLRLKVRVSKYKDTVKNIGGELRATVFGRIEGVEVYADSMKIRPMYITKLQDKRVRRFRGAGPSGEQPPSEEVEEGLPIDENAAGQDAQPANPVARQPRRKTPPPQTGGVEIDDGAGEVDIGQ